MKKLFTLAAAVLASVSMWAALPLTALPEGTTALTSYSSHWTTVTKNVAVYDDNNYFMALSQGNAISFDATNGAKIGNSSKSSAVVFYISGKADIEVVVGRNGSDMTATLCYLGTSTSEISSSNVNEKGTELDSEEITASNTPATLTKTGGAAGYYKIHGSLRFCLTSIKITYAPTCTSPATALSLSSDAAETVYVGDEITFSTEGGNGGAVKFYEGESEIANPWTATAGAHTIVAKQEANGDYCETVSNDLAFNVLEKTPVTACVIDGPTNGFIGDELVYTATAANATVFEWYLDGAKQGSDSAKYIFTAAKGTHQIFAIAYNEFNTDENKAWSEAINVSVTKLCGELIKATTGGTVTGVVGGTYDTNNGTGDTKKLDKKKYYGIKLASGTFMAGDVFTINVTTAAGLGKCMLYADKNGSELIVDAGSEGYYTTGELTVTLPAAANGKDAIYLYREDGNTQWNPTFSWISVSRSCEESDNNNASVTINGEAAEKSGTVFNYTLGNSYTNPTVDVVITLEHPLATLMEDHAASFTMPTPEVGTPSVETFKVKAENGEQAWYSIFVNKAAGLSNNADLSALSVAGLTLSPDFAADVTEYTVTKAYSAAMPAVGDVTATPADANAKGAEVTIAGNVITVTVTAEDNTTKDYTITVNSADAKKDLLRVTFSNGVHGYIASGNIRIPYLAGTEQPTFVSATFWEPDGEPTAVLKDGKLVVTGIDEEKDEYTLEFVPVTPKELNYEEETFTDVPDYIFSVYGWDSGKGVKFSKDVEEASNHRISEGKDRIYIALPAAGHVILTGGNAGARPIKITVNGNESDIKSTPKSGETIKLSLNKSKANFIGIESNGNNGDAGFTKLQLQQDYPTALDNTDAANKAIKTIENGQIVIIKNGVRYNVLGAVLK